MAKKTDQEKDPRPIMCGTDFSATAVEAVNVAGELARKLNVKLVLAHVEEFRGVATFDAILFEQLVSQSRRELERETERIRKLGTNVEHKLVSGPVFEELIGVAADVKAQLVVVGAVGHGVARRLLVGSVAERVAETSSIPTLVVRPGGRLGSWVRGEHPLKILVGYDFSSAADAALRWVNGLQKIGPCEINVVHIDWPPEEAHRLGYHGPLPLTENPTELQTFLERDLSERVAMCLAPEKVTITVEPGWGHSEGHLFEIAHRHQPDVVVVGTNRRHGWGRLRFGSVSRTVLHHATITVAVVPPPEEQVRYAVPKLDRVLVATDFSDLGNQAVAYGCAVLRRGGTLKLIHVIEPSGPKGEKSEPKPQKGNPKILGQLRAILPRDAEEIFDIETEVFENANPGEAIAQEGERFDADAICVGSHGRSGIAKAFLGSVAQMVLTTSKRPVLIVREQNK